MTRNAGVGDESQTQDRALDEGDSDVQEVR